MTYVKSGCEDERDIAYMQVLDKRLNKNSHDVQALFEKGFLYVWPFCKELEGVEILQKAVDIDPLNVDAYFWLAKGLYHGLCDNEGAKKVLEKALELDPNRADCLNLLADLVENSEEAIVLLKRAVASKPDWPWLRIRLASYLLKNDRIDEAEKEAQETLRRFNNLVFPETKTPIQDYYETFTGRYPEFKNDIDNFFLAIDEKRKEFHGAEKSKT